MKTKSLMGLIFSISSILLIFNYVNNHLDIIYGVQADYYFKKNNIKMAQEFYEKAFEQGLEKTKQREIYINSIINSPLTIESQEKLIKFLENPKKDIASLKTEYFLYDLRREIHRKYPHNYITNAVYNHQIIRWGNNPITYKVTTNQKLPNYFIKEIENAFTELEKATEHQVLFVENTQNPNIIIKFEEHTTSDDEDHKFVVAYTTPILELNKLKNMEIIFYLKDTQGKFFSQNQVYNTALHEIIHSLGIMGHCEDKNNIMYLTKDSKSEINDSREKLTEADINTIKLLYKIKPQITNINTPSGEYIHNLVLGTEEEVVNEKINEALIYIKKAPELPAGYIDLAEGYVAEKDYSKAIKSLEKALRYADSEEIKAMIYFNLAVTNFYIDNLNKSKSYLNLSINIKDSEEKQYLMGEIYVREGNIQKAIEIYKYLLEQNEHNIEYAIALTNIFILNKDYINARKILKNYIKNNPQDRNNERFNPYGILKLGL